MPGYSFKPRRTLFPSLPPIPALTEIMRPLWSSFVRMSSSMTVTSEDTFPLSFSSSLPHSIPFLTRAQCALCKLSSSGAPRVYDKPHEGHVRRVDWSMQKCSCVNVATFWLPFAFFPLVDFLSMGFFFGGRSLKNKSAKGRFRQTGLRAWSFIGEDGQLGDVLGDGGNGTNLRWLAWP